MTDEEYKEIAVDAAHSAVVAMFSTSRAFDVKHPVDEFFRAYFYSLKGLPITDEKINELAKAAAHSAVVAMFSTSCAFDVKHPVDEFFRAFLYAKQKLKQMTSGENSNKHL